MFFCLVAIFFIFRRSERVVTRSSAGQCTGSYRILVFIFLMIWIFKILQYRCHLNNFRNVTLLERGFFSLLHCGEDTALCVTKRESSETEAVELVQRDDTEELIHNIHRPHLAHTSVTLALYVNLLVAFLHRIYKLTNLATFLDKPYGSVRRSHQCCPASARSDSPGAVSPLSASVLCSERRRRSSAIHFQNSVSKHLPLTDSL